MKKISKDVFFIKRFQKKCDSCQMNMKKMLFLWKDREKNVVLVEDWKIDAVSIKGSRKRCDFRPMIAKNLHDFHQVITEKCNFHERIVGKAQILSKDRGVDVISVEWSRNRHDFWQTIAKYTWFLSKDWEKRYDFH